MIPVPKRSEPPKEIREVEEASLSQEEKLLWRYRLDRLMEMGFDFEDADRMIPALAQRGLDWHYVKGLLDQGCPLLLAKRISA
jgi:hypothetical protein